jgi:ATP-dependent Clp protease ATP-binding subunit ClpA
VFERFTAQARASVVAAAEAARDTGSALVGREHLLIGVAAAGEPTLADAGIAADELRTALIRTLAAGEADGDAEALRAIGVDVAQVRAEVERNFGPFAWSAAAPGRRRPRGLAGRLIGEHRPFTPEAKKTLELALREAVAQKAGEITSTHCLLGLLRDPGDQVTALLGPDRLAALRTAARRAA